MEWLKDVVSTKAGLEHLFWGAFLTAAVRAWQWVNGQTYEKKKEWAFWILGFVIFSVLASIVLGTVQEVPNQRRGLHAQVLGICGFPDKTFVQATNLLAGTNSSPSTIGGSVSFGKLPKGANLSVVLRIENAGSPSTAFGWKAFAVLPGGTKVEGNIPILVSIKGGFFQPTGFGSFQLTKDNNLLEALSEAPLATGSAKIGWLPLHLSGFSKVPDGTKIVISFTDAFEREKSVQFDYYDVSPDE
jgi:hypothetical protein